MKKLFFILILFLIFISGCAPKNRCVNVYYFHAENGFNKGLYVLKGTFLPLDNGYWNQGLIIDTEFTDRDNRCKVEETAKLQEAWYSVHFPGGEILYGTGGAQGIVYVSAYSVRTKELEGKPCYGFGCKRKVVKEEDK